MGLVLGRKPEHETLYFLYKVAAGGVERYLLCAAGPAGVVPSVIGCVKVAWYHGCMRNTIVFCS